MVPITEIPVPADSSDARPDAAAVIVFTTLGNEDDAVTLVRALLERRLVACGTILPAARSLYRWEGRVADESEVVVLLKTTRGCLTALEAAFGELHPYRLPEVLAVAPDAGSDRYIRWIADEVRLGDERSAS